jgi:hypothetical protein
MNEPKKPWIVWSGKLAMGGRMAEEFDADVVLLERSAHIVKRNGITSTEVSPHQVRGDAWLSAFAALAKRVKELEASRVAVVSEGTMPARGEPEADCG